MNHLCLSSPKVEVKRSQLFSSKHPSTDDDDETSRNDRKQRVHNRAALDLIGKATPGTFQPSLQIDGTAKLLIKGRSGRWSYDTDRGKKEPFGIMSPMRFRFSSQR